MIPWQESVDTLNFKSSKHKKVNNGRELLMEHNDFAAAKAMFQERMHGIKQGGKTHMLREILYLFN
jgi:hypothetical protein